VLPVENYILRWAWLQATRFLEKGRNRPNRTGRLDFMEEGSTETNRVVNTS
jgi:hypothetical protein